MGKNKLQWGLPEIAIDEAAELIGHKVDDLFYLASKNDLTIYFLADGSKTKEIYKIDESRSWLEPRHVAGPEAPPYGSSDDPEEWDRQMQAHEIGLQRQDVSIGKLTTFGRLTDFKYLYEKQWKGCQPIATETFSELFDGITPTAIQLDLDRIQRWEPSSIKHFVRLDPESQLKEACFDGKLFVMKADLLKIFGDDISSLNVPEPVVPEPVDAIAKVDVSPPMYTQSPAAVTPRIKDDTQAKYDLWQAEADKLKQLHPSWLKSHIVKSLTGKTSPIPVHLRKSIGTMRKRIKI